jgi:excisionase family DNA binding protein
MPHCVVPEVSLAERACFSAGEAAALAGLSVSFLYILMERGALRSVKLGGRRLIPRDALVELVKCRDLQSQAAGGL